MGGRGENLIQLRHSLQLGHLHGALLHALRHAPGDGGVRGDPFLKPLFQKHVVVPIEAVGGAVVRLEVVPGEEGRGRKRRRRLILLKPMRDSSRRGTSYTTHTHSHTCTNTAQSTARPPFPSPLVAALLLHLHVHFGRGGIKFTGQDIYSRLLHFL